METALFYQGVKIGLTVALPIGPIALLCIRKSLHTTFVTGLALALGTATANVLYAVVGALSLSTVNHFLHTYRFIIELLGVAVILYLGITALRHGVPTKEAQECTAGTLFQSYFSMALITLTSPMTVMLFAGVFAGMGIDNTMSNYSNLSALSAGVFIATACWFTTLSGLVTLFKNWFTRHHIAWINKGAGVAILLFGLQRLYSILSL